MELLGFEKANHFLKYFYCNAFLYHEKTQKLNFFLFFDKRKKKVCFY
jgi:hypothetical protein